MRLMRIPGRPVPRRAGTPGAMWIGASGNGDVVENEATLNLSSRRRTRNHDPRKQQAASGHGDSRGWSIEQHGVGVLIREGADGRGQQRIDEAKIAGITPAGVTLTAGARRRLRNLHADLAAGIRDG